MSLKILMECLAFSNGSKNVNEKKDAPLTNTRLELELVHLDAIHGFDIFLQYIVVLFTL